VGLIQLIYISEPFGFDEAMLAGILVQARRNNPALGITGCLVCRNDLYLQLLEGEGDAIEPLYARIAADDRHLAVTRLANIPVSERLFPDWAMRDDPAQSWLWNADAVAHGAARTASPAELQAIFGRIAGTA
jgi:Sensors of blue-light using FAD